MKFHGKNIFLEYAEYSDEWTKAILTREEFESFRKKEETLKKVIAENENQKLTLQELEEINKKIYLELNTIKKEQVLLKAELAEKLLLLEKLTSQNENLLRINRERSNAERKLYPKKLHNGYVLLHQEIFNKNFNFKTKGDYRGSIKTHNYNLSLYRYRFQTPYLCNLELDSVKALIIQDIKKYYDLDYLEEIPKNVDFFEAIKIHKYLLNLKISTSDRFYLVEFSSNIPIFF